MDSQIAKFQHAMRDILEGGAGTKGYGSPEGPNPGGILQQFVRAYELSHTLGEIVYKVARYRSRRDPQDLLKIAAWAYMEWANVGASTGCHVRGLDEADMVPAAMRTPGPPGTPQFVATPPDHLAPTEMPTLKAIRRAYALVEQEALQAYETRPGVANADPVRLAALVAEEAGEALKEALDATRPASRPREDGGLGTAAMHSDRLKALCSELVQTAAMALIAVAELRRRDK